MRRVEAKPQGREGRAQRSEDSDQGIRGQSAFHFIRRIKTAM